MLRTKTYDELSIKMKAINTKKKEWFSNRNRKLNDSVAK